MTANAWDESYDTIVAGTGVAGLSTALSAAERGLDVLILEKADELGGSTAWANTLWVGANHLARAEGIVDHRDDVIRYMRFVGGDQLREENLLAFVDEAPKALEFYESCGVRWRLMSSFVDHYYPDAPGSVGIGRCIEAELVSEHDLGELSGTIRTKPDESTHVTQDEVAGAGGHQNPAGWDNALLEERREKGLRGRGAALVIHLLKALLTREVEIERRVAVADLVVEAGRVVGVVTSDGRRLEARRGVALTTGGYESNPALVERFENLPGARSMFVETSEGDGLVLGSQAGGGITVIQNNMAVLLGFSIPASQTQGENFRLAGILELLAPHTIVVNQYGRRFADESYFQNLAARLRDFDVAGHGPANWPSFLVFDQQFVDKFSFAGGVPGEVPDWVTRADTASQLARKLGIDPSGLTHTVERFNGFAEAGVDEDFSRPSYEWSVSDRERSEGDSPNPSLGSLSQAPYYGIELFTAPFSSAGLSINAHAQVIDLRDQPIPGLYSAGNAAAHTEYGIGYQAGYSLASGLTFGYLAGRHMAYQEKRRPRDHASSHQLSRRTAQCFATRQHTPHAAAREGLKEEHP